jgi:hypothetical protein
MFGAAFMRGASHKLIGSVFKNIFYLERFAKKFNRTFVYYGQVMERKPILKIGIGNFDVKTIAFLSDVYCWIEPGLITIPVDLQLDSLFDKKPRIRILFVFHEIALYFHRYFHSCGKPSVLLSNFCGEGSDIISLPIFKFKEIVFFFVLNSLEISSISNRFAHSKCSGRPRKKNWNPKPYEPMASDALKIGIPHSL